MIKVDKHRKPHVGSFGAVYRAYDTEQDQNIAIKVLQRDDDESIKAFRREFQIMSSLASLSCVPGVFSCSFIRSPNNPAIDQHWGIFMEHLSGKTLKQLICSRKKLNDAEAALVARKVLRSVGSLHGHDVLHRDLHVGNIFLCDSGEVKVLDYGQACSAWLASEGEEELRLSNGYEPPEATWGNQWSRASDIYMIAKSIMHLRYGRLLSPDELPDTQLAIWIGACTQSNPQLRPQTCDAAAAFLPTWTETRFSL